MKLFLLSMLATAAFSPNKTPQVTTHTTRQASDWVFSGHPDSDCVLEAGGDAMDSFGANLSLRCGAEVENNLGNATSKMSAQGLRQKRVTISGEIQTEQALSASLWLKVMREGKTLMLETTAEQTMYETTQAAGWVRRSLTVVVPSEATAVSFGLLLQGGGEAEVRNLRLTASGEGAACAEAQQVLDAAIEIVKAQTAYRNDISWPVLEAQVRVFAAGAEQTAEVYPAIKYLLSQLGDKQSLLLTPDLAGMFHVGRSESAKPAAGALNVYALPDGAKLVLSAEAYDARLAKVWNRAGATAD